MRETDDHSFVPDFAHRYLTEDVPYGLVVIRGIAEIVQVDTPSIDKVLLWAQEKIGKEYLVGSKLQGKDVTSTRAPQRYGLITLNAILGRVKFTVINVSYYKATLHVQKDLARHLTLQGRGRHVIWSRHEYLTPFMR